MSLISSLSQAMTGLARSAKAAELVAENIANANKAGYAKRSLSLHGQTHGQDGLGINAIVRQDNGLLLGEHQLAAGNRAYAKLKAGFYNAMRLTFGDIGSNSTLEASLNKLEADLRIASVDPSDENRLASAFHAAQSVVQMLNKTGAAIQKQRELADHSLRQDISLINQTLSQLETVNQKLSQTAPLSSQQAGLRDQQDLLLQDLAQFLPFKQIERAHGAVALYTVKGQILLDSHAAELAISETGFGQNWPPPPAVESAQLQIKTGDGWQPMRLISGAGSLSATQDISLKWASNIQAQTDQLAFKLSQIFSSLTEDTSLHGDNPGLFTDLGGRVNADRLEGLASRLRINASVNPDQGGQLWRMRDGVYAEHPAEDISGALLAEMADQLSLSQALEGNPSTSVLKDAQMITAQAHRLTNQAEENLVTQQAYLTLSETALAAHSVDTDIELQELLQIETAFAANAKMLQTVDEMMQEILRIGR